MTPLAHPLVELSQCADPASVRHPAARAAVVNVIETCRKRLGGGDLWLKPEQIVGSAYAQLANDRCLIGDQMGIGKTLIALSRIAVRAYPRTLVVATASTLYNWEAECRTWLPRVPVHVAAKQSSPYPNARWSGIVLTTWGLLEAQEARVRAFSPVLVVADEAHKAANPETLRSQALARIAEAVPHLLLLTGTPFCNEPIEMFTLLQMLDPSAWTSPEELEELQEEQFDAGALTRFKRKVCQYMVRRLKSQIRDPLPPKRYEVIPVKLPAAVEAEYRIAERRYRDWLYHAVARRVRAEIEAAGRDADPTDPVFREAVFRRVNSALNAMYLTRMNALRRLVGIGKVPAAVQWIAEMRQLGESIVVFIEHQEVRTALVTGLHARGIEVAVLEGKTTKARRQQLKEEFRVGAIGVLILTQAGKEGITLTRARHVLRVERWWNPASEDQGDDRVHRHGQQRDVRITELQAAGTIDERMDEINAEKRVLVERLVGDTPRGAVSSA